MQRMCNLFFLLTQYDYIVKKKLDGEYYRTFPPH
jgi:hypothetical protein